MRAAELGYEALALTDHDGVYGSLEFAHAAKAFGVRPITGAEVTLVGGAHVTLLVESQAGYSNLCRLLTEAHRLRVERGDPNIAEIHLADAIENLTRRKDSLSDDRSPKDPYRTGPVERRSRAPKREPAAS